MLGLRGAVSRFVAESGFFLAAALAFFFLVCVIPLMLLGVSTIGFVLSSEAAAQEVVGQLTRNFPVYRREISAAILRIVGQSLMRSSHSWRRSVMAVDLGTLPSVKCPR